MASLREDYDYAGGSHGTYENEEQVVVPEATPAQNPAAPTGGLLWLLPDWLVRGRAMLGDPEADFPPGPPGGDTNLARRLANADLVLPELAARLGVAVDPL